MSTDLAGVLKVWDLKEGLAIRTFELPPGDHPIAFTADSNFIAAETAGDIELLGITDGSRRQMSISLCTGVTALATSPNGRWISCGDVFGDVAIANLDDLSQSRVLREVPHPQDVSPINMGQVAEEISKARSLIVNLTFSADSQQLAAATVGNRVFTFDTATGRQLSDHSVKATYVSSMAFSPNHELLVAFLHTEKPDDLLGDGDLELANLSTGTTLVHIKAPHRGAIVLSSKGTRAVFLCRIEEKREFTKTYVKVWDLTGIREIAIPHLSELNRIEWPMAIDSSGAMFVSRDGEGTTLRTIDLDDGKTKTIDTSPIRPVNQVSFSRGLLAISREQGTSVWNKVTGEPFHLFSLHSAVALTRNGKWRAYVGADASVYLAENRNGGQSIKTPIAGRYGKLEIEENGNFVIWTSNLGYGGTTSLWRAGDKEVQALCTSETSPISQNTVAISPSGAYFAIACSSGVKSELMIFRAKDGAKIRDGPLDKDFPLPISDLTFSEDGASIAATSAGAVYRLDAESGAKLETVEAEHNRPFDHAIFGTDAHTLLTSSWSIVQAGANVEIRDISSNRVLATIQQSVRTVSLAMWGKFLAIGAEDGTTLLVNTDDLSKRITVVDAGPKEWLVVTSDGWFDGTASAMRWVGWRMGTSSTLLPLDSFFSDYYRPGLLAEVLAGQLPNAEVDIANMLPIPGLKTLLAEHHAHPEERHGHILICFEDVPGVALQAPPEPGPLLPTQINGYRVVPDDPTCKYQKDLPDNGHPKELLTKLAAWAADVFTTKWDGRPSPTASSRLHVLSIGIEQYPSESGFARLPYASRSATAFERFFLERKVDSAGLFADVQVWPGLYDSNADYQRIENTLGEISRKVNKDDIVLLYIAGHGLVTPGQEMFYFVPYDGRDEDIRHTGLNTAMLAEVVRTMTAQRVVLIIDACQSGGAVEALSKIGEAKARIAERLEAQSAVTIPGSANGIGVHVIAATTPLAYAVGLKSETSALAATLLEVLNKKTDQPLTVGRMIGYIKENLPKLSEQMLGYRQTPLTTSIGLDFAVSRGPK